MPQPHRITSPSKQQRSRSLCPLLVRGIFSQACWLLFIGLISCSDRQFAFSDDAPSQETHWKWQRLAPLPESRGVASPFAGVYNGRLIVAGGANFPDRFPWEGGQKVWHDRIWQLDSPDGTWREAGRLPRPLGYGITISTEDGLICIGGSDAQRHFADVFRIVVQGGRLHFVTMPSLPRPIANGCGALAGRTIYVAGGTETPTATSAMTSFLAMNLDDKDPKWIELPTWPGPPRMLSVAAVLGESFYLISGARLSADDDGKPRRQYLSDAYAFQRDTGWKRIADVPHPTVAAPSPAPIVDPMSFLILGGDDGTKIGFQPIEKHPGFPNRAIQYHATKNQWKQVGTLPVSRVTVPVVKWQQRWLIPSGEQRPGVRSPEVWSVEIRGE